MVRVTLTEEKKVAFPLAQVPEALATPLPSPPPPPEPLQLQVLQKLKAATEACPRAAEFPLQGCGDVLVKMPSTVLARKLWF